MKYASIAKLAERVAGRTESPHIAPPSNPTPAHFFNRLGAVFDRHHRRSTCWRSLGPARSGRQHFLLSQSIPPTAVPHLSAEGVVWAVVASAVMRIGEENFCPTYRPTKAAFEKPFCQYVREVFAKDPDLPCFKVVPPKGWVPRKGPLHLERIRINTPIKQHVFGKGGAFVCILEEQRGMTAADFKRIAARPEHQPPGKGHREDKLSERAFWSGVTNSPPLYGADTPISLFDEKLGWGWNLRHLGCMLQSGEYKVPDIPGVTSPMTYFGMWKSFFGWHKEDIDLYSINYLHCGAPKVWYCVSPKDNPKFDAMAQALYPDLYRACHGFMRHKDILISPRMLRAYNVPYTQAKQEAGEFIVLNAAAYHAGFNLGFNVAEAVNFAMEDWLDAGKAAVPCSCTALPQGVQLDMGIFCPELREETSDDEGSEGYEEEEEEEEEGEEEGESSGDDDAAFVSASEQGDEGDAESSEDEEEEEEEQQPSTRRRIAARAPAAASRGGPAICRGKRAAARADSGDSSDSSDSSDSEAEAEEADNDGGSDFDYDDGRPAAKRQRSAAQVARAPQLPEVSNLGRQAGEVPRGAAHSQWGKVAEGRPLAIVEKDEETRQLRFSLVHRLAKASNTPGSMWVGQLEKGPDGLYRPQLGAKLLALGMQFPRVVRVRVEWVVPQAKRRGGWALKTKQERILM